MPPMHDNAEVSAMRTYRAKNIGASAGLLGQYTLIPFCLFSLVVGTLLILKTAALGAELSGVAILALVPLTLALSFPGNLAAFLPYKIEVYASSVRIVAHLKAIEIPFEDIKDVRSSPLARGYIVRFKRRRGLLFGFVIDSSFGLDGDSVARVLENQVSNSR